MPKKPFKGIIKLDVRDSVPDWEPYLPAKAPAGSPNILFVLYDDTRLAAWSPFGGGINMPTLHTPSATPILPPGRSRAAPFSASASRSRRLSTSTWRRWRRRRSQSTDGEQQHPRLRVANGRPLG
jgi:hypothetical protein